MDALPKQGGQSETKDDSSSSDDDTLKDDIEDKNAVASGGATST